MKRSFVYLLFALALSLLLCGCGSMENDGKVTASPWPDVTEPVLPVPTATVNPAVTASPGVGSGTVGSGADTPIGTAMPEMSTSSPRPADTER